VPVLCDGENSECVDAAVPGYECRCVDGYRGPAAPNGLGPLQCVGTDAACGRCTAGSCVHAASGRRWALVRTYLTWVCVCAAVVRSLRARVRREQPALLHQLRAGLGPAGCVGCGMLGRLLQARLLRLPEHLQRVPERGSDRSRLRGRITPLLSYVRSLPWLASCSGHAHMLLVSRAEKTCDDDGSASYVNAGSFVIGSRYVITRVVDTDFTLVGASSSAAGVYFTATGAGSGSGEAKLLVPVTCGAGQHCVDGSAPAGGYTCVCDDGFFGETFLGPAVCTGEAPCADSCWCACCVLSW
jgi:hypothetical protein